MSKTTRVILGVIILLLLIVGAYFVFGKKSASSPLQSVKNQVTNMATGKRSLTDFFSMTGSQQCTFSDKTNTSSGTLFVADGKMRGDFQSSNSGKTTQTHMINDGTYIYYWTDGAKTGYKMSLATVKEQAAKITMAPQNNSAGEEKTSSSGPVNMNQQADYSCQAWSADSSKFVIPQDVTFTDYTTMMQGAMKSVTPMAPKEGMTTGQKQSECGQCNQVPAGQMRNQCLTALKCE